MKGRWFFKASLCDAWVAADVMACTASILNLTAISVDRFIAVTQPIKYAKHKNSKRTHIMIAVTWAISFAIAAPITLGVNTSEERESSPNDCRFYNSDFIIYSSMGSFYIPSIIMMFLYGKIFVVLKQRSKKFHAKKNVRTVDNKSLQNVIENTATTGRSTGAGGSSGAGGCEGAVGGRTFANPATELQTLTPIVQFSGNNNMLSPHAIAHEEPSVTVMQTTSETPDEEENEGRSDDLRDSVIKNDNSVLSPLSDDSVTFRPNDRVGYCAPNTVEIETQFNAETSTTQTTFLSPPKKKFPGLSRNGSTRKKSSSSVPSTDSHTAQAGKKSVTKFNFRMRHSKKKKETRSSAKRERKATMTLAIVLAVFFICWMPFFTVNIMSAFCLRYKLSDTNPMCNIHPIVMSFCVWLGYINSFLNPVIYTIFNMEFRKAFKRLLTDPCRRRRNIR